jgi:predicted signal transduction protein with EAL and GGDEF domain
MNSLGSTTPRSGCCQRTGQSGHIRSLTRWALRTGIRQIADWTRAGKPLVVAEGSEDVAALEALRRMGCDTGQGYYFAHPIDAGDFERWRIRYHDNDGSRIKPAAKPARWGPNKREYLPGSFSLVDIPATSCRSCAGCFGIKVGSS